MSEFEQIREALGLTLDEMAAALGSTHATVHRWESAPNTRSGRQALESAKALYKKRTKQEWKPKAFHAPTGGHVTREEYGALLARLDAAEKSLKETRDALVGATGAIRQLGLKSGSPEIEALLK